MKKMKDHWKELLPHEKKFEVATWILFGLGLTAFLFEILDKFGIIPIAIDMFIVVKGILAAATGCQAVVYWRKERGFAHMWMMLAIAFGLGVVWDIIKLFI